MLVDHLFNKTNSCTDNWALKCIRVPTIEDTIDYIDTHHIRRVFFCKLKLSLHLEKSLYFKRA